MEMEESNMGIIILGLLPILALYMLVFQTRMLVGIVTVILGLGLAWVVGMGILMAVISAIAA
jgi:hypothetical protein